MPEWLLQDAISTGAGGLVGLTLGLVGGGGSILAVPLLVYVVGVASPHVAIGTSALAVAVSAAANLIPHARLRSIKWSCALVFALAGVVGAIAGSTIGKNFDGQRLLVLFSLVMVVTGIAMLRGRKAEGDPSVRLTWATAAHLLPRLIALGAGVGMMAGFFGIGGGFLIVPGLILATGMPVFSAIGSSLVAVTAFGLTTAANYALSDLIDWRLAAFFILGGFAGGAAGAYLARLLSTRKGALNTVFAILIFVVAGYMFAKSAGLA